MKPVPELKPQSEEWSPFPCLVVRSGDSVDLKIRRGHRPFASIGHEVVCCFGKYMFEVRVSAVVDEIVHGTKVSFEKFDSATKGPAVRP